MRSDAFGCIWMRSDAFGHFWKISENSVENLVAPPFHRPRRCRNGGFVGGAGVGGFAGAAGVGGGFVGSDGSYQFLRAAGAPVRRRGGRGPPRHAKIDFFFC